MSSADVAVGVAGVGGVSVCKRVVVRRRSWRNRRRRRKMVVVS